MFKKAKPEQAKLKFSMYGPPGSGKTFTALLFAEGLAAREEKRIAYIDTEHGTDFYCLKSTNREVHPEAFEFDAVYTRSLSDCLRAAATLDPAKYGVLIIDSISHIWQAAIDAYEGRMVGRNQDKIPLQAWQQIKKPYKELIDLAVYGPFHTFICGRQKNVYDTSGEEWTQVGVAIKAEGETQYEPTVCLRMSMAADGTILAMAEKDRTGVLSGRTFPNPSFRTIEPLLALLGTKQHQPENAEERMAKDAELLEEQERKRAEKAEKSTHFFREFQAQIAAAKDVKDLGPIVTDVNKKKRSMSADDLNALRLLFENRREELSEAVTGEI